MKKVIFAILLVLSFNAHAGMWTLVHHEYLNGGWMCTYQQGGYQTTIRSASFCQSYIFD